MGGRRGSLAVNRGQKRTKKVSCSDKGGTFLTAAFFNFSNAFGFCRIVEAVSARSGPLEV